MTPTTSQSPSVSPSDSTPADQPVMLSDAEREVVERMRMTPEQRQAEVAANRQAQHARVPAEVRKTYEAKAARMATMTQGQRRVYHLGQHLVSVLRILREETRRGVKLADMLETTDSAEAEILTWFLDEAKTFNAEPSVDGGKKGVA